MYSRQSGFTFLELLVSLAVAAIAIVALIRLHLVSLAMADRAQMTTRAVLLAEQKLEENVSAGSSGFLSEATQGGTEGEFEWQSRIIPFHGPYLNKVDQKSLQKIEVDVAWQQGRQKRHYVLATTANKRHDQ